MPGLLGQFTFFDFWVIAVLLTYKMCFERPLGCSLDDGFYECLDLQVLYKRI